MLVPLTTKDRVAPERVGGKAASLVALLQGGFNVPDGLVLTTEFFAPWLRQIERVEGWQTALGCLAGINGQPNLRAHAELAEACDAVKAFGRGLEPTQEQAMALAALRELGNGPFAVRSSSPQEDLAGASFAGQYETVLDVARDQLVDAIKTCFVSCLDSRVLLYKRQMGFTEFAPALAVVVQRQLQSDVSGVAFSQNPLTNDYDELLINASWGLGEALVSGDITPDSVVVDKVSQRIIEERIGNKGEARSGELCLSADQVRELSGQVVGIEALHGVPVDVEWAFAGERLHILQSRPITTGILLEPDMLTEPGAPRRLYFDSYLTDGVTMSGPVSTMGNELMQFVVRQTLDWASTPYDEQRCSDYGMHFSSGRTYFDISVYLHLMGKGEALAKQAEQMDPTIAAVLMSKELDSYRPETPPRHLRRRVVYLALPRVLWRMRRAATVVVRALSRRKRFAEEYSRLLEDLDTYLRRPIDYDATIMETLYTDLAYTGTATMNSSYPGFMIFYVATHRLKGMVDKDDPEQTALIDALLGGYEDDMIVNMGGVLFDLAQMVPADALDDIQTLEREVRERALPQAFMEKWDHFMHTYGSRGPLEMDVVNPRYGDAPRLVLQQIASIARSGGTFNPHEMLAKKVRAREAAYQALSAMLPRRKVRTLDKLYADVLAYCGAREYFKHHLAQIYHRARKLISQRAEQFLAAGRIDRIDDIFQISMADIDRAHADSSVDLRQLVEEKGALYRWQRAHVRHFPLALDSRGRIFRPQVHQTDLPADTISGAAVSAGVARGPVKVLNDPFEKPVDPGDILVAVTTDPGWTPLFINAAAVILEIGGELQHGALVAREYGKPCISGVSDVTHRFKDGEMVEVDGNAGLVRVL